MTLAKFSGSPSNTMSSRVAAPATMRGTRVNSTSLKCRKAIHNMTAMTRTAKAPASMKARTTVCSASMSHTGVPVTSGAIASTAAANRRDVAVSFGSPPGSTSIRARPSGATQSRASSGGTDCTVTRSGRSMLRRRSRSSLSGAISASRALSRTEASALASRYRRPDSREAALATSPSPAVASRLKSVSTARIALTVSPSDGDRRRDNVGRADPDFRDLDQLLVGADRLTLRVLQVDRIEVEAHSRQQRQAGQHHDDGSRDHGNAVPGQKSVGRRERDKAHPVRLAWRTKDGQQSREQRDGGNERGHHAEPGDHAELGDAAVGRRHEREEPEHRAGRGQRQGPSGPRCGTPQGSANFVPLVALGPVAHGELDAEIGCEANEEDPEGDRDQVECANDQQARGRSHEKADAQ